MLGRKTSWVRFAKKTQKSTIKAQKEAPEGLVLTEMKPKRSQVRYSRLLLDGFGQVFPEQALSALAYTFGLNKGSVHASVKRDGSL